MKILAASILTIFTVSFLATLARLLLGVGDEPVIAVALVTASVSTIVASIGLLVWGLPIHIMLSRLNRDAWGWYALAGFIPAPVMVYLFRNDAAFPVFQSLYFGVFGIAGALVFWFYVVKPES